MSKIKILWVDDEIDMLKPHIMFLEQKGYEIVTANSGDDALDIVEAEVLDIVFLDENMPGITGLETLGKVKEIKPELPVVMITKSEEERIMDDAIGGKIADYLIKPVNPNQILLSLKKNLDERRLVTEKTTTDYQREFRQLSMEMSMVNDMEGWHALYQKLLTWELKLDELSDEGLMEILAMQKREANDQFGKFIANNYEDWMGGDEDAPLLSHQVMNKKIGPLLRDKKKVLFVLIDNLRMDQWKVMYPEIAELYRLQEDDWFSSILPTATQYARNAIFSGLTPREIKMKHPNLWVEENDEEGKNIHEEELLGLQLRRLGFGDAKYSYNKITQLKQGKKLVDSSSDLLRNDLNVVVYNFVDMLSHAKTEMGMIKQLADDDKAYRSLTLSWFKNSPLIELLRKMADKDVTVVITTDHGTINVTSPVKVIGQKDLNTNLRYKTGRHLSYNAKEVFEITDPERVGLPKVNMSDVFIFSYGEDFFAYPNNYNHYVRYYQNTFQHGGISMEEMIIPLAILEPK
jgi:CheY-like chemotaxis protein